MHMHAQTAMQTSSRLSSLTASPSATQYEATSFSPRVTITQLRSAEDRFAALSSISSCSHEAWLVVAEGFVKL